MTAVTGLAFLTAATPALLFPDVIPAASRTVIITILAVGAAAVGTFALRSYRDVLPWLLGLVLALCLSWFVHADHDAKALSHFGGACLGILVMAAVARTARSDRWLTAAFAVIVVVGTGVLIAGLLSISLSSVRVLKFGALGDWIWWKLARLPDFSLPLPGLLPGGKVNPNALAGTAAALLPLTTGLSLVWRGRELPRVRWLLSGLGLVASLIGLTVLTATLSRGGLVTVVLTAMLAGIALRPLRRPVLGVVVAVTALTAWDFSKVAEGRPHPLLHASDAMEARVTLWTLGWEAFRKAPWLGIGINQFHPPPPPQPGPLEEEVAHAHNIFLQVALDIGVFGLLAYLGLGWIVLRRAVGQTRLPPLRATVSAAAGFSLVAIHLFGLGDAIALGAKVGIMQWWCAGLILAAGAATPARPSAVPQ